MAMQATRALDTNDMASGTFSAEPAHDPIAEAHRLACQVESLLIPANEAAMSREAYGHKIARAIARSLIDQLADLSRDRLRSRVA